MKYLLFFLLCANVVFLSESCSDKQKTPLNPNGDSELAILMRQMYDEADHIKNKLQEGEDYKLKVRHSNILSAQATMPEKAASQEYKSFAQIYLRTIEEIKNADTLTLENYNQLVNACTICHQSLCPGPLVKINKLKI